VPPRSTAALAPKRWDNLRALIRDSVVVRIEDIEGLEKEVMQIKLL
jgi:hypothetical protein